MLKLIKILLITWSLTATAGLPPTASKVSGESNYLSTFNFNFGSFTGTRSGTSLTLTGIGAATGTSLVLGSGLDASALLDVQSTSKGVLIPRMTTAQKTAISSPATGLQVYDTTLNKISFWNGSAWTDHAGLQQCSNTYECTDTFSAQISTGTGTVSNENVDWINGNCTAANGTVCTLKTGLKDGTNNLSNAMNCIVSQGDTFSYTVRISSTTTTFTATTYGSSSGSPASPVAFNIKCQKVGSDYIPKTAIIGSLVGYYTTSEVDTLLYGMAKTPGITSGGSGNLIDVFSVAFGGTAITNACTGGSCFIDQIGNAVTSISFNSSGDYTLNFSKTYSKVSCSGSGDSGTSVAAFSGYVGASPRAFYCTSCSSLRFRVISIGNVFGNVNCTGRY